MNTVSRQLGGGVETDWATAGVRVTAHLAKTNFRVDASAAERDMGAANAPRRGTLLLVEDELLVGMEMANALQAEGWTVMGPAGTVEEAFALLSDGPTPDAAVLDINLNGQLVYPVADLLRTRDIPYLFCTGYETLTGDDRHSDSRIVHKPTNLNVLIKALDQLISGDEPDPGRLAAA